MPLNGFEKFWTGLYGRHCLAHAGYAWSNNNTGVEVDWPWRTIKKLALQSSTIGTFMGTLTTFIHDLSFEHQEFLSKTVNDLFPAKQVLTKRIYDSL